MSKYYNAKRTQNIYDPRANKPFKLSRSKLDLFLQCPRCFYLDRRRGIGQPPGFPFNLNSAVDALLKKEFDIYREKQKPHPLIVQNQIDAIPFKHEKLEEWRDALRRGITFLHDPTNFLVSGGIDDVWINSSQELIIVDYKATSKSGEVGIEAEWQVGYKRQMSLYSWLFKKNGFKVHEMGYFVYCNGLADRPEFNQRLEFSVSLIPYKTDDSWVEESLRAAHQCLNGESIPQSGSDCDYCKYVAALNSEVK